MIAGRAWLWDRDGRDLAARATRQALGPVEAAAQLALTRWAQGRGFQNFDALAAQISDALPDALARAAHRAGAERARRPVIATDRDAVTRATRQALEIAAPRSSRAAERARLAGLAAASLGVDQAAHLRAKAEAGDRKAAKRLRKIEGEGAMQGLETQRERPTEERRAHAGGERIGGGVVVKMVGDLPRPLAALIRKGKLSASAIAAAVAWRNDWEASQHGARTVGGYAERVDVSTVASGGPTDIALAANWRFRQATHGMNPALLDVARALVLHGMEFEAAPVPIDYANAAARRAAAAALLSVALEHMSAAYARFGAGH